MRDVSNLEDRLLNLPEHEVLAKLRLAEHHLAASDERMRSFLQGPVALVTIDADDRLTFAGGAVLETVGLDAATMRGALAEEVFPGRPDVLQLFSSAKRAVSQDDVVFGDRCFHVYSGPLSGESGGAITVSFDITDRVMAEKRLSVHARQQAALVALSRLALDGGALSGFLAAAVRIVAAAVGAPHGAILEYSPVGDEFIRVTEQGESGRPRRFAADPVLLATRAYHASVPLSIGDYEVDPAQRTAWLAGLKVASTLACAIDGPLRKYGVLGAHWFEAREFSSDEIDFIGVAAGILSVAIERRRSEDQRRLLLERLVAVQEQERKRIAADIHDDAVQVMTAANLRLEVFRKFLTNPQQQESAGQLQETVSLSIGRLRRLLFELSPPGLEMNGLAADLRLQLQRFSLDTGVPWTLEGEVSGENTVEVRTLLYRVFQEALTNIRKHARPGRVMVGLTTLASGARMTIADDGDGFSLADTATPVAGHLGLASMRERAEMAGGSLQIETAPGAGTVVTVWVPIEGGES